MQAIEFEADVKNFRITVPRELAVLDKKHVRLVAMFEDKNVGNRQRRAASFIDNLISNPLMISDFSPLKRDDVHAR